ASAAPRFPRPLTRCTDPAGRPARPADPRRPLRAGARASARGTSGRWRGAPAAPPPATAPETTPPPPTAPEATPPPDAARDQPPAADASRSGHRPLPPPEQQVQHQGQEQAQDQRAGEGEEEGEVAAPDDDVPRQAAEAHAPGQP